MVVDQADRDAGCGAYAAYRDTVVAVLLQTTKGGLNQSFAAYRRCGATKFRHTRLFLHLIPFSEPHPGALRRKATLRDRPENPCRARKQPPHASIDRRAHSNLEPTRRPWKWQHASRDRPVPSRTAGLHW